jgi:hypothetical protein
MISKQIVRVQRGGRTCDRDPWHVKADVTQRTVIATAMVGGEGVMKKTRVRRRREHEVPSERTRRTIARGPTENIYYNDVNDDILYSSNAHVLVSDCRAGWRSWSSAAEPFADADGVTLGT